MGEWHVLTKFVLQAYKNKIIVFWIKNIVIAFQFSAGKAK